MSRNEEITFQSLAEKEEVKIGYSDNDMVIVDSIQKFAEINAAHIAMNVIMICTDGKIQARMNNMQLSLSKNQVAIIPQNVLITDIMVSPDFNLKALFLTNSILQSLLREKMVIWNDVMYIHHHHVITLDNDYLEMLSMFYDMLNSAVERRHENPFGIEIIQSILTTGILTLCGKMKMMLPDEHLNEETKLSNSHFQRFLEMLHNSEVKYRPVDYYASELCISPKHLTSICKKISGKTASEWIREQVLEDIRFYLKKTDLSIKQVCNRVGFTNTSFFGKYVKGHLGMTPMEYRNS
ncbi:MAG: AraC family transcriptional regulator [Muribaculaceae bacterium]|nr:AraC family transcriptional regulator [Muribaculaceae bacterium]